MSTFSEVALEQGERGSQHRTMDGSTVEGIVEPKVQGHGGRKISTLPRMCCWGAATLGSRRRRQRLRVGKGAWGTAGVVMFGQLLALHLGRAEVRQLPPNIPMLITLADV